MQITASSIRTIILEQSMRAGVGHIGSALCIAEIVAVLYSDVLRVEHPQSETRDRFVLSKGHAALAVYAALFLRGWIGQRDLDSYCENGSLLGVHPDHRLTGIDFSTGSLGQGISYGVGSAFAARMLQSNRRVVVLLSDAECNEGSVWESVMFAAHHRLSNLVLVIDDNHQQALGPTANVLDLSPIHRRFEAFGCDAQSVDGHDSALLRDALMAATDRPRVVVAQTVFGRGVSFMERRVEWHYKPMSAAQCEQALAEILRTE